jgi:hypothetical protein
MTLAVRPGQNPTGMALLMSYPRFSRLEAPHDQGRRGQRNQLSRPRKRNLRLG